MARKIRNVGIIICFVSCVLYAGNNEELFLRANKLYESHDYDQALSMYETISPKGRAVLYNIGSCYFHKNDYSLALLYWMKAESGATIEEKRNIYRNKLYVLEKLGKTTESTFLEKVELFFNDINSCVSLLFLQILFLVIWYFCIFFLLSHGRKRKKIGLLLAVGLGCLGIMLFYEYKKRSTQGGFIVAKEVSLLSGPDQEFEKVGSLRYSDYVIVRDARKGWYKVQYSGSIGWVQADAIHTV